MAIEEYQHTYTDEIVCPHCAYEFSDSWDYANDQTTFEAECTDPDCGKKFEVERNHSCSYSTSKLRPKPVKKKEVAPPPDLSFQKGEPVAAPRVGEISVHDTGVHLWEENVDDKAMALVFQGVLGRLYRRGFEVERDPKTLEHYPTLANTQWYGKKGILAEVAGGARKVDLEVFTRVSGRTIEANFFQSLNTEHSSGARYDHQKLRLMPRSLQIACVTEMTELVKRLLGHGYTLSAPLSARPELALAVRDVADGTEAQLGGDPSKWFKRNWTHIARDENGFMAEKEYVCRYNGNGNDRDGVRMRSGDERYFYADGYLMRGRVYPSVNGQALAAFRGELQTFTFREFFSCDPTTVPRRLVPKQVERLEREIDKALKAKNYPRVRDIGQALVAVAARKDP